MQSRMINRRIVLAQRPRGAPTPADFRLEEAPVPQPREGEVLLRTLWLSLDPYMRGRMNEGPSYAAPVEVGAAMGGETVSRVEESRHDGFRPGDLVATRAIGWQDYGLSDGTALRPLGPDIDPPSCALGVLGMPGFTAYVGLLDIGQPRPGETVAVAAATGAVGSVVGQLAKIAGCLAVGIAGGPDKCRYAVKTLGLDACIDHRADDFAERLAAACPQGIDVYFENVAGRVLDAVLPLINIHGRIPLCGTIAHYNAAGPDQGIDRAPQLLRTLLVKRITLQGFIIIDHYDRFAAFLAAMSAWVKAGRVKYREDIVDGLENAPAAFIGLLEGHNFGKLVVRVGES
jgi:NADPH-dependent curcumin reductase CurA